MSDPNQPYQPQPYPKALYRDHGTMRVVANAEEHAEAADEGFVDFADLSERPVDDLELMTHDQLVAVLIGQLRKLAQGRTRDELLQMARVQKDIEVHNAAVVEFEAKQKAAVDEAMAALGAEPGEEPDHVLYGHSTLETVEIDGETFDAGMIAGDAFKESGLTDAEWNDLPTASRDAMIVDHLKGLGWIEPAAEVTIDLEPEIEEPALALAVDAPVDPLDHDADGEKGGAVDVTDEVESLRAELTALGIPFDGRWRAARLREAIQAAKAA